MIRMPWRHVVGWTVLYWWWLVISLLYLTSWLAEA